MNILCTKEKNALIQLRVPKKLKKDITEMAKKKDQSVNLYMFHLLKKHAERGLKNVKKS